MAYCSTRNGLYASVILCKSGAVVTVIVIPELHTGVLVFRHKNTVHYFVNYVVPKKVIPQSGHRLNVSVIRCNATMITRQRGVKNVLSDKRRIDGLGIDCHSIVLEDLRESCISRQAALASGKR